MNQQGQFKWPIKNPLYSQQSNDQPQWGQKSVTQCQPSQQQFKQPWQQLPMMPPQMPQRPKKKSKLLILGIIAGLLVLGFIGTFAIVSAGVKNTPTISSDTSRSSMSSIKNTTNGGIWTAIHTFTGIGSKKTGRFPAAGNWKINWTCKPSSFISNQYNIIVMVYNANGSIADPSAVATICKAGNTSDSTEEHTRGQVYLDVESEGDWMIQVQELK